MYGPGGLANVITNPRLDRVQRALVLTLARAIEIDAIRAGRWAKAADLHRFWREVHDRPVEMDDQTWGPLTEFRRVERARNDARARNRNCEVGVTLPARPRCPACTHLQARPSLAGEPEWRCAVGDPRAPLATRCARWMRDGGSDDVESARGMRFPIVGTAH